MKRTKANFFLVLFFILTSVFSFGGPNEPDIKKVDSSHEGFGRQMYLIDISSIVDNPPE